LTSTALGRTLLAVTLEAFLRRILFALMALLAFILLVAARSEPPRPGEMILAMSQEPDGMDPVLAQMVSGTIVRGAILRELMVRDDKWNLVPDLASEVPTLDNGGIKMKPGGGMVTTYKIRPEATWSDGVPVTARDFMFIHKIAMDKNQPVVTRDTNERVEKMESPDPKTLVVHWKEPFAYSAEYRVFRSVPAHIYEPIYEKEGANYHRNAFDGKVGNGPYVLDQWISGDRLILRPNPHWYGPKPSLQKVTYRIIPSTNTQIVNLLSHTVDALSCLSISLDQALDLERKWGHIQKPNIVPGLTWEHIAMRTDDPILKDIRVRRAILFGIDRKMMAKKLFDDRQPVADSWLPPRHYGYKKVLDVQYDPEKSKALLAEAGWKPGPDGICVNDKGEKLVVEMMTTSGNQVREQAQQVIQSQLRQIGIHMDCSRSTSTRGSTSRWRCSRGR
jgi:peptide/nickel transport system substrate-binding protein